jgi:hypothetical protein
MTTQTTVGLKSNGRDKTIYFGDKASPLTLRKQGGGWFLRYKGNSVLAHGAPVRFKTLDDAEMSITHHLTRWLTTQG